MFFYNQNKLSFKQSGKLISVGDIAKGKKNPFYLYDIEGLKNWYRFFVQATNKKVKVFFAMKSNFNKQVLTALRQEGSGVDVVSGGEVRLAKSVGFGFGKMVFSGIGKSVLELRHAVKNNIFQVNVESFEELKRLNVICKAQNKVCAVGLRINPNIDFKSHPYIKTGLRGHKFGLEQEDLPEVLDFLRRHKTTLRLQGVSMHLGSQIFDLDPLFKAIAHLKKIYSDLKKNFHRLYVLDIGGGFGINYQSFNMEEEKALILQFGKGLKRVLKNFDGLVIAEPGRFLVARFGVLCARVEYVKKSAGKTFVILNAGMNDFLRPALYGAKHRILPLTVDRSGKKQTCDIVGPICETGDTFVKNCRLPAVVKSGDWLAVADTGAYGSVMASPYNLRPSAREICFYKGKRM